LTARIFFCFEYLLRLDNFRYYKIIHPSLNKAENYIAKKMMI